MKPFGALLGLAFGFVLAWAGLSDPQTISDMLLLRDPYVFLMMGSGVATAFVGLRLLKRFGAKTAVERVPVAWSPSRIERRHVVGSVIFGAGWAICGACPGPVAVQLGEGRFFAVFTALGILSGVLLAGYLAQRRGSALRPVTGTGQGTESLS